MGRGFGGASPDGRPAPSGRSDPPGERSPIGYDGGMKILVIEDDAQAAAYMVKGLRESGHVVDHSADGKEGLFMAGSETYDVLIVDEAQNLHVTALEELRMLSNFTVEGGSLFQSFLVGQPQFKDVLADPALEQFRQRVIASYHLGPLSEEETAEYVRHRLRLVGWNDDPAIDAEAFALIHRHSGGIPRRINTLCSRLLLFGALEGLHAIDAPAVEAVVADLAG